MGVQGTARLGSVDEGAAGPVIVPGESPVLGDDLRGRARLCQAGSTGGVDSTTIQPGHVGVESFSCEFVTERHAAVGEFDHPRLELRLARPGVQTGQIGDRVDIERVAEDRRHPDRPPCIDRQLGCAHQYGVSDPVGQRQVGARRQLETTRSRGQQIAEDHGSRQLGHEERDAVGPAHHRIAQRPSNQPAERHL